MNLPDTAPRWASADHYSYGVVVEEKRCNNGELQITVSHEDGLLTRYYTHGEKTG